MRDWRCSAATRVEAPGRFIVLHGDNGQGKTNLLEAVYLLANLKSFREARIPRLVRHGAVETELRGVVSGRSGLRRVGWRFVEGRRELSLDGTNTTDLQGWFQVIRAVLFFPDQAAMVRGEPELRREHLDRATFNARPSHLENVRDYRRALAQKSALLREGRVDLMVLEAWNERLARLGARLAQARSEVLAELRGPFQEQHGRLVGLPERVDIRIRGLGAAADLDELEARIRAALEEARPDELRRGRTLVGPHRDDLEISLGGRPTRHLASQGQARSLVLALKLAELEAARLRGEAPVFLLDDLTSELDRGRMGRLIELLGELPNQVWITTTDPRWLGPLPPGETSYHEVQGGGVLPPVSSLQHGATVQERPAVDPPASADDEAPSIG